VKRFKSVSILPILLLLIFSSLQAGKYYVLCEGNIGQTNASLWSMDESLQNIEGPLIWNTSSNPMGDVGQSLTLYDHTLYIVMNGSHEVRVVDLESGETHIADIEIPNSSPRFMAVHAESGLAYISSWGLSALLIVDLESNTVIDTLEVGARPEEMLISGDELFVTLAVKSDSYDPENKVLRIDIGSNNPVVTHTYDVINGPGAMALIENQLYVTSIYYNDAWETFSGTSRINLSDHSVVSLDHGYYTNYTADINLHEGVAYRTYGRSIVPLNQDLSLNQSGALGDLADIYSHSLTNNHILVGSSDFIAPDLVTILALDGEELASFNVGALPGQIVYYTPDLVSRDQFVEHPATFSLKKNYPNPFNPSTSIPFSMEISGSVRLNIYDIRGGMVTTLVDDHLPAGDYISKWNGRDAQGKSVSSGIYHAILKSNSHSSSIKLNLIK